MRLVKYGGAMSLDGYIAGPSGEYDWILTDPDIDFAAVMAQYDTFLIGRKTFEAMGSTLKLMPAGTLTVVFSRTLVPAKYPGITISNDAERIVADLRSKPGKDIALFGGGELFGSLLRAGLVDRVEVSLIPALLGGGIPFLPPPAPQTKLRLLSQHLYKKTGILRLEYEILHA